MTQQKKTTRRQFLKQSVTAAGAMSFPLIVPSSVLGGNRAVAPSERIVVGFIGTGGRGQGLQKMFMDYKDVQVVAVCDVDARHRQKGLELVNKFYKNQDCAAYKDFRELVARKDMDAVVVATPDHWHALTTVAAAKAGKDIYCEKPLANSVGEGRAVCEAVKQNNRILQTGSHERSGDRARFACELVRNERIGKLHTLRIHLPCSDKHHKEAQAFTSVPPPMPIPEGLDYNFWLGHTKEVPYTDKRCHFWWRFNLAYGGGEMTDRGAHVIDLAQLGAGHDDTGPVEIEGKGIQNKDSVFDVFWDYSFVNTFANGVKMIGDANGPRGVKFEGTDGWVFIHVHGAKLEAEPASLLKENPANFKIQLGRTPGGSNAVLGGIRSFLDSVKSRHQPSAPAEAGHRTASLCHLNNIAMLVGRKLKWDPSKELFVGDDEANRLLTPVMRSPWQL